MPPKQPSPEQHAAFFRIFHIPLSRFWSPVHGFDIIKFDEIITKAVNRPGLSIADICRLHYSPEALTLISGLIDL